VVGELLGDARLGESLARRIFGDLAYRSEQLSETLAHRRISLVTERSRQNGRRQQAEVAFSILKRIFGTCHALATRVVAKIAAYTHGLYVNRLLGRPQGQIKTLWA